MIEGFVDDAGALPKLKQAWLDGAYWFHEGLAEPLETIAVPKLETAIEVLLSSESTKGSEARIRQAIHVFHGRSEDAFINPDSEITVKEFAKRFVMERSRILHGTYSTLNKSLGNSRSSLAEIARIFLRNYAFEIHQYQQTLSPEDNVDAFLNWVSARRTSMNYGRTFADPEASTGFDAGCSNRLVTQAEMQAHA